MKKEKAGIKFLSTLCLFILISVSTYAQEGNNPPEYVQIEYQASARPDRILLSWDDHTQTTQTVTWRTDTTVRNPVAEIAVSEPSRDFDKKSRKVIPVSMRHYQKGDSVFYHSARFTGLQPATTYVYRIGDGRYWSEWIQFRTADPKRNDFSFIYLGDAQTRLFPYWTRLVRAAYAKKTDASFILHAGDLINNAGNEYEWGEWFAGLSFIHHSIPIIAIPGNHEYYKNEDGHKTGISKYWKPQFNFPDNGIRGLEESNYFIDYKSARIVALNSNERIAEQAVWLDSILKNNPQRWTIVTFHHPVLAASKPRVNEGVYDAWKPLLDKYRVDLVLQGHDHAYARGTNLHVGKNKNKPKTGTVYVISVSGPKKYDLTQQDWMESSANNTQLFQVIDVNNEKMTYKAYTPEGNIYDAFDMIKRPGDINQVINLPVEMVPRK